MRSDGKEEFYQGKPKYFSTGWRVESAVNTFVKKYF